MTDALARLTSALADRYQIERELGAGGMATVYLAKDLRHDRKVALKVLRAELSAILGAERFLHEIKTTANLQHPHILPLHDSGEAEGIVYYVMPYVEGESLRDRLTREKQLPVDDAVRIAREVLGALDYAHRHGVVHRDIKPENILLHEGQALVADFGIALAVSTAGAGTRMTETGLSLGTPHYMSPEQAMGEREITAKSDVYALGCVVYEMLVGEPPFTGPTAQAIVARVMTEQPRSLTLQRHTIPPHVEAAVRMALEKLPADRFASAAQFAEALSRPGLVTLPSELAAPAGPGALAASAPAARRSIRARLGRAAPWAVAVAAVAVAIWSVLRGPTLPPAPRVIRFALRLPHEAALTDGVGQIIAFSPDGSRIVYRGQGREGAQLFVRGLDQLDPAPIPGTMEASNPFFSPDGRWLGFTQASKLSKVAIAGGPPLAVTSLVASSSGLSWGPADTIVFATNGGLMLVPAAGGEPRLMVGPDSGRAEAFIWPEWMPDGRAVLFTVRSGPVDRLAVFDRRTRTIKRFEQTGSNPRYVAGGFVALGNQNTLVAVPFDSARLEVVGSAVPVVERIYLGSGGAAKLGVSRRGDIAYAVGGGSAQLALVDRGGAVRVLDAEPRGYAYPRLSPDGRRIALSVLEAGGSDIWVYDLAQHTRTRLTFDQTADRPAWTPDGRRIAYSRRYGAAFHLFWVPADGGGTPDSLLVAPDEQWTGDFTPDGRSLVYRNGGGTLKRSLWTLDLAGARTPHAFLQNEFENHSPALSPDGRWVAYTSDESGRNEIYVRPLPGPGGKWQVSLEGGTEARWSPTGREIFYRVGNRMMAAQVRTAPTFSVGDRAPLFEGNYMSFFLHRDYDVTPDGKSFVMLRPDRESFDFLAVLNWFDQLRPGASGAGPTTDQRP